MIGITTAIHENQGKNLSGPGNMISWKKESKQEILR